MTSVSTSGQTPEYDVAIIGAGPSGALAAKLLCDIGLSALILEGAQFPRFSIGESLLPNCLSILEKANLLRPVVEAGFQYKNGAAFERGSEKRTIDFRNNFDDAWGTAYQVQRAEFDQILADNAEKAGAEVQYGCRVTDADLQSGNCTLTYQDAQKNAQKITSRFVLDASGYGRVLPRLLNLETPSNLPARSVLFTHMADRISDPEFDRNKILIMVHPKRKDVWYWLIPFSNGTSSVGVVFTPDNSANADHEAQFADLLTETRIGELLKSATPTRDIGTISGYSCNVSALHGSGYALLGNAAEFLDPVFSSGVTIALHSAELAVPQIVRELNGETPQWEEAFAKPLKRGVDVFRIFVEAWYDGSLQDIILKHPEGDLEISRMMVSILSGYAWSDKSPLVQKPERYLKLLKAVCK